MSIRKTNRTLTGHTYRNAPEVVVGYRVDGTPGVTVHFSYKMHGSFDDAENVRQLICDLGCALDHMLGEDVSSSLS